MENNEKQKKELSPKKVARRTNKVVEKPTNKELVLPPDPKTWKDKKVEKLQTPIKKTAPKEEVVKPLAVSEGTAKKIDLNDIHIKISNSEGYLIVDESCCTALNIILQKDGNLQTSFLGSYNNEILKVMSKSLKVYFKNLKKKLKYKNLENKPEDVKGKK